MDIYLNKRAILIISAIVLVIVLMIISVNIRLGGKKTVEEEFIGYEPDDPNDEEIVGDEKDPNVIAIYEFENLIPYFKEFGDAIDFKDYLNDYIINSGEHAAEWWIKDIDFDKDEQTLTFFIKNRKQDATFFVKKSNKDTLISKTSLRNRE